MTKEQVLNSNVLKKKFCKDCNIPISVYDNPYFLQRLCALDPVLNCVEKFDIFCGELSCYSSEQDYCKHYNETKDLMINAIKGSEAFQRFLSEEFKFVPVAAKRNLYIEENDNGQFISIDMKKANFSALRYYSNDIFDGCSSWEEFVECFTSDEHIASSKYIRQVVLGACNPKRQIKYEHFLMNKLFQHLAEHIEDLKPFSLGEDEIILKIGESFRFPIKQLESLVSTCPDGIGELVRVEKFSLHKIPGTDGWMKEYWDSRNDVEFKCLEANIYHQVVKYYFGEPIEQDDLVFYNGNRLAKFLKEIDDPWNE